MPRLSLYKPEKGNDYKFIDRQASEMFQAGGTDVYLHKYLGANTNSENATADQPAYASTAVTNIQDLLFLENRDRKYDSEVYRIRGMYNVQNIDFNLSQFGLFIDNDTLYMTVHINDFIKYIGRKPVSGDVIELPHLRDDFALNDFDMSLPRYYVIEDVGRASEGFSVTWFPHLYRLKIKKITDNQQYADIFNQPAKDANGDDVAGTTLKDLLSTYNKEIQINSQIVAQAEADAPKSGYETRQFYTLAVDSTTGSSVLETADLNDITIDSDYYNGASAVNTIPVRTGYTGYLVGDGFPANGHAFGHGIQFPNNPAADDFFLRTDFLPNRLFRFNGPSSAWVKVEDAVRMNMTNDSTRQTLKTGFINNDDMYMYTGALGSDYVKLTANATVVNTNILYSLISGIANTTPLYIVLKFDSYEISLVNQIVSIPPNPATDYANILSNQSTKIVITLPVINGTQKTIPRDGSWVVTIYTDRQAQKQALSKALKYKPQADL